MKILFVNPIIYTSETAKIKKAPSIKDTMSYDLCLAFKDMGHNITLVAGEPFKPEKNEDYPFNVVWAKCALPGVCKPNALPLCPEVIRLVKDESFDLIISSEIFSLNSLILALFSRDNLFIWHELAKHNNIMHKIPSKLWYNTVAKTVFKGVPVIARSKEAKEFISQFCNNVYDRIIDHGVNLDKFKACENKEKYFIVASQLIERKRIDVIIEKFGAFSKTHDDYKLCIFGEGDKETELREQAKSLKLDEKVVFFGKASHDTLKKYLAGAGALLVYTRKDNNMVSISEAIACATPVVTTSVPYNASYIKENGLGIVNDNWDESDLEEIISDKKYITNCLEYRTRISAKGKVEEFLSVKSAKNILLSSYSVNPYHGSEDGIGWNWTLQLAKHYNSPDDKVYLVTKKVNAADTRKGIEENGLKNVKLTVVDTPDWLNWYHEHRSVFHHAYYMLWQRYAYRRAKKSKINFDIIHHITMVDFRIPGHMYKFKKPVTIFGPVGGGQSTPAPLKDYEASRAVEKFREAINKSRAVLPSYKRAMKSFDRVFAINKETQKYMSAAMDKECEKLCELALADEFKGLKINKKENDPVKILYLGRLIEKKGVMLLLDVIKAMPEDKKFTLEIYGGGPLEAKIKDYIKENSLEKRVKLCGEVEHTEVSKVYSGADIFVMPSLRETSGNVLVEAMAHMLPVVALDMSVASDFKEYSCGEFVNVEQSKNEIINEFANKLTKLIDSPELRIEEGKNGYRYVNEELSWEKKFEKVYDNLY